MVAERKNNNNKTHNFPFSQPSRSALHVVILRRKRVSRIMKTQSGTTTQSKCCKMFGCRSIKLHSSALLFSYDTAKKSLCSCTARMFIHMRLEEYCLWFLESLVCAKTGGIPFRGYTFGGVYIPCIYSHAWCTYCRRFRSLSLCPLSVERYYFPLFVDFTRAL